MVRLCVSESEAGALQSFIQAAGSSGSIEVVGVARSGRETADAVRAGDIDALLFPDEWSELCRAIRVSVGVSRETGPSFIVGATDVSSPLLVKAALYGFEGATAAKSDPAGSLAQIADIVAGTRSLTDEPVVRELGLAVGALAREVAMDDENDREIADLVASGLPDADIARIMSVPLQRVRKRIEHLLHENGLTYRTQLAVLRAAVWKVPDFS